MQPKKKLCPNYPLSQITPLYGMCTSNVSSTEQPGCVWSLPSWKLLMYSPHFSYPSSTSLSFSSTRPGPGVTSPIPIEKPRLAGVGDATYVSFKGLCTVVHDLQRKKGQSLARRDMQLAAVCKQTHLIRSTESHTCSITTWGITIGAVSIIRYILSVHKASHSGLFSTCRNSSTILQWVEYMHAGYTEHTTIFSIAKETAIFYYKEVQGKGKGYTGQAHEIWDYIYTKLAI